MSEGRDIYRSVEGVGYCASASKKTVYPSTIITHCVKIQIIQYDDDSLGFQSTSSVQVLGVN